MKERAGRLTLLADVAKRARVSVSTASRVLSNSDYPVAVETRQRVLEAAEVLDFSPNWTARGLVVRRTNIVGLVVDDLAAEHSAAIARGANDLAIENGFVTLIGSTDGSPEREIELARRLRSIPADAVLYACSTECHGESLERLVDQLRRFEEAGGVLVRAVPHPTVSPDVSIATRASLDLSLDHLAGLGHRAIGIATGPERHERARLVRELRTALEHRGFRLDTKAVFHARGGPTEGRAIAEAIVDRGRPCTAILARSDALAMALVRGLEPLGVSVPADLSVVGFGDVPSAALFRPALTTLRVPWSELGAAAMRTAIWLLGGGARTGQNDLPVELVVRESTGPSPSSGSVSRRRRAGRTNPKRGRA